MNISCVKFESHIGFAINCSLQTLQRKRTTFCIHISVIRDSLCSYYLASLLPVVAHNYVLSNARETVLLINRGIKEKSCTSTLNS
jgi:hypothetical protein